MERLDKVFEWLYRARRRLATVGVGVLAMSLGGHVIFGANGMVAYQQKRAEHRALQNELERLQVENERLQQQIQALRSDPKAIEREAREQLRYARPGEVIYTVPQPPDTAPQSPSMSAEKR
jgi:cell division protein FtsB